MNTKSNGGGSYRMGQLAEQLERSKKEAGDSKVAGTEVKNTKSKAV